MAFPGEAPEFSQARWLHYTIHNALTLWGVYLAIGLARGAAWASRVRANLLAHH